MMLQECYAEYKRKSRKSLSRRVAPQKQKKNAPAVFRIFMVQKSQRDSARKTQRQTERGIRGEEKIINLAVLRSKNHKQIFSRIFIGLQRQ